MTNDQSSERDPAQRPPHQASDIAGWGWASLGVIGGVVAAWAVYLPLVVVPLVGSASYAEDNAARGKAVLVCALAAAVCCAGRWFRPALLCSGIVGGLLLASTLEKIKDLHALQESTRVPPGAGEMTRQYAAMSAQTLAATHPRIGAFLLPGGCLLGIAAASVGSVRAARREGRMTNDE